MSSSFRTARCGFFFCPTCPEAGCFGIPTRSLDDRRNRPSTGSRKGQPPRSISRWPRPGQGCFGSCAKEGKGEGKGLENVRLLVGTASKVHLPLAPAKDRSLRQPDRGREKRGAESNAWWFLVSDRAEILLRPHLPSGRLLRRPTRGRKRRENRVNAIMLLAGTALRPAPCCLG